MVKCIGINCLVPSKNIRNSNDEDLKSLAENIKMTGLLQPLTVRELDDEKYEIVSGHRRFEALKMIGETIVECNVVNNIDSNRDLIRAQLSENIHRKDMTPFEYVKVFNSLKDEYGLTNNQIAMFLNKSVGWVNDQYFAADILKRKYGSEDNIPPEYKNKAASTIKGYHYNGSPEEKSTKVDCSSYSCEYKRHTYKIYCKNHDFENKLLVFLHQNNEN